MAFIRVPNTVQVEMVFQRDNVIAENVYHAQSAIAYDATDMADLIDVFRLWWINTMADYISYEWSLANIIATDLDDANGPRVEDSTGLPAAGEVVSEGLPNHVTAAVKWTTNYRGRSYRGRTYHIGFYDTAVTGNKIATAHLTGLSSRYGQLLTDIALTQWVLVVASKFTNNAPRSIGVATPITGYSINETIDSQRRRLPGRGR